MKLANMILILIVIQAVIVIYDQVYDSTSYELDSYADENSQVWNFVLDPTSWSSSSLLIALLALGAGAAAFIAVGTFLNTPSDTAMFSPAFVLLIGAGAVPIISLYNVFSREVAMFGCTSMPCTPALILWALSGGFLAVFYILSVLEWWSGRSTG